jgi:hypothetical protein
MRLRIVGKHQQEISALNERLMKAQEHERKGFFTSRDEGALA